jgi:hypothetical protein
MTIQASFVSVNEYLRTDYSPDCDYVDGVLEDRVPDVCVMVGDKRWRRRSEGRYFENIESTNREAAR